MKPVIDTIYSFDQVHEAFDKSMSKRANGKLVISWSDEDTIRQAQSSSIELPAVSANVDNVEKTMPRRMARQPPAPVPLAQSTSNRRRPSLEGKVASVPYVATTYHDN